MIGRPRPVSIRPADRTHLARVVTDLLAPANLAVAQLLLVSWHSSPGLAGLGWGLLTATFCGLIPYGIVMVGVRRGRWTDRHVRIRQQRPVPFLARFVSRRLGSARRSGRSSTGNRARRRDAQLPRRDAGGELLVEAFAPYRRSQRHGRHPRPHLRPGAHSGPASDRPRRLVSDSTRRPHTGPDRGGCRPRRACRNNHFYLAALIGSGWETIRSDVEREEERNELQHASRGEH